MNTIIAAFDRKFITPKLSDSFPYEILNRRIFILPTRHGFMFAVFIFAILLASFNNNNNLGFLLGFLLLSILLVSIFQTHRNLLRLVVLGISADPVFAGELALFRVSLSSAGDNRGSIDLRFIKGEEIHIQSIEQEHFVAEVPLKVNSRGIFRPGILVISTKYPFALFRAWTKVKFDGSCIVYPVPKVLDLTHFHYSSAPNQDRELEAKQFVERSCEDELSDLRSYVPGDPPRSIYWKSLSRGHGLYSKSFSSFFGAEVLFDLAQIDGADLEERLSYLTYLVLWASELQLDYKLKLGAELIDSPKGAMLKMRCLSALALYVENDLSLSKREVK